ncbi:MAG: hypothetical protein BZ138_05960 [Methanosphaera sp. rholeuAM270]|nr:MAG: hypothetical protein BZ138_05960 [Methanosphaera sp. rholeuAM270]
MTTFDCKNINLKKGSKDTENVKKLQKILTEKGYYTGKIDGDFGKYTENAVKTLQKNQGNDPDGWFGPKTCAKLESNNTTAPPTTIIGRLEKASKTSIKTYKSLYNAFKKFKYDYYANDIYNTAEELKRVEQGKGLNCTDHAQLYMQAYKEAKYTDPIRIVRGVVTCSNGKAYGHVWCQVYVDGAWLDVDPSAAAAHGYGIGTLICTRNKYITNINPGWAVSDDGIT